MESVLRRVRVLAAWAAAALLVLPSPVAAEADPLLMPQLAGVTTIRSDGIHGITLDVPDRSLWFRDNVTLTTGEGVSDVFVGLRLQGRTFEFCEFCFAAFASVAPGFSPIPFVSTCDSVQGAEAGCDLEPGPLEVYIVSDGPVTLTMRFPELSGVADLQATGAVAGIVEQLPFRCDPLTDCTDLRYGGRAYDVGTQAPVYAQLAAWIRNGPGDGAALQQMTGCAYPGSLSNTNASANEDDYPYGCRLNDPNGRFITGTTPATVEGGGSLVVSGNSRARGEQYLGFMMHRRAVATTVDYGATAMWFRAGIDCPSGDFHAC